MNETLKILELHQNQIDGLTQIAEKHTEIIRRHEKMLEELNKRKMNWRNYIRCNSQSDKHGMDCQLVTTINAYYHLTGKKINQASNRYKKLADLAGCCYGSCIDLTKVWKELGIKEDMHFEKHGLNKYLKQGCFIEVSIWHKNYGYHSVAIIDYSKKTDAVRITNFRYATSTDGWIFVEDLKPHLVLNPDKTKPRWHFRTFKLVK